MDKYRVHVVWGIEYQENVRSRNCQWDNDIVMFDRECIVGVEGAIAIGWGSEVSD